MKAMRWFRTRLVLYGLLIALSVPDLLAAQNLQMVNSWVNKSSDNIVHTIYHGYATGRITSPPSINDSPVMVSSCMWDSESGLKSPCESEGAYFQPPFTPNQTFSCNISQCASQLKLYKRTCSAENRTVKSRGRLWKCSSPMNCPSHAAQKWSYPAVPVACNSGGGGGGGGGCPPVQDTRTWVIGPTGEPRLASEQLQFGLERVDGRPETTIYLEEWAVLSVEEGWPEVQRSSTPTFGMQVAAKAHGIAPVDGSSSTLLIVESAEHPQNARHILTPTMVPVDVTLDTEKLEEDQEFLFRAEVAATGVVDDVTLLDASALLPSDHVRKAIAASLHLQYADVRRHRSVVHGRGTLASDGRMVVENGLVIVVMCCCDDDCCFDPEWEIWLCPCGQPCQPT